MNFRNINIYQIFLLLKLIHESVLDSNRFSTESKPLIKTTKYLQKQKPLTISGFHIL